MDIVYEIIKKYGTLSSKNGREKVVLDISWNGRAPKLEIRETYNNGDKIGKGIAIDKEEIPILIRILEEISDTIEENKEEIFEQAIDYESIFSSGADIANKRRKGYLTHNGKIVLQPKK